MFKLALETIKISLRKNTVLRYRTLTDFLDVFINTAVIMVVWYFFFNHLGISEFKNYTLKDLVVYYIIVSTLGNILYAWLKIHYHLQDLIISGKISNYLTKPWNIIVILTSASFGGKLIFLMASLLFFILALFIGNINLTVTKIIEFLIVVLLSLIFYILFLTSVGLLAFWYENIWSISWVFFTLVHILSGKLFPLEFYPRIILKFLDYLPFKYLYFIPTKTLIEGVSFNLFLKSVFVLGIYTLIFSLVVKKLWVKGIKKINIYGG